MCEGTPRPPHHRLRSGQKTLDDLIIKRGVGSYVAVFHEGEYFRQPRSARVTSRTRALEEDPLFEPLRRLGVDEPAVRRILGQHSRSVIQRWMGITDAAVHEHPQGFDGFRTSPAAFLIDGIQHKRMPPDWYYAHEKKMAERLWQKNRIKTDGELRQRYQTERAASLQAFLESEEGSRLYQESLPVLLSIAQVQEPHRPHEAAQKAARERLEKLYFQFPDFETWSMSQSVSESPLIPS